MSPQDHANHLLRIYQQRRALGFAPHERLPQDNKSEAELDADLAVIRECLERVL